MPDWSVLQGDCVAAMAAMDEASVDAVVTDPPYGLEFMGKEWDNLTGVGRWATGMTQMGIEGHRGPLPSFGSNRNPVCRECHRHRRGAKACRCGSPRWDETPADGNRAMQAWHAAWAAAAFRVLKPGGHLVAFGGTRTHHRLWCAVEDAGFEVRDTLAWLYGSGFPKSLDVSKAIDKAAGAEREVTGAGPFAARRPRADHDAQGITFADDAYVRPAGHALTAPASDAAREWAGWGTALKPAFEPIILARKPLSEPTVAANVLKWGTGALNVDGCRVAPTSESLDGGGIGSRTTGWDRPWKADGAARAAHLERVGENIVKAEALGRWPANVVLDEAAAALLDEQSGERPSQGRRVSDAGLGFGMKAQPEVETGYGDLGGASRFFYCAKADAADRAIGLDGSGLRPIHPTVKPVALMQWLVRLVTPPGGLILDPFCGSGSTGIAALREGFRFVGIEREAEYVAIARARIVGDAPLLNGYHRASTGGQAND